MSEFEKWFEDQDFYTNMRFIHGDKLFDKDGDVYRVLPVQMTYQAWNTQRQRSKDEFVALTQEWHTKGWNARQGEIEKLENELSTTKQVLGNVIDMEVAKVDNLKAQLNNMEASYIEKKKECEAQQKRIDEYKKLTTSIRNEFDLWSDDSEFADVIEAQIENLEALRGANDSLTDMRQKVENQINNGARLTKHQIDL